MFSTLIKKIKKRYGVGFVIDHSLYLVSLNLGFVITALCTAPWFEHPELWFQRVGSLMSVFTLAFELMLINRFNRFSRQRDNNQTMMLLEKHLPDFKESLTREASTASTLPEKSSVDKMEIRWTRREKLSQLIIFINVAIGTIIWGYGDLIYLFMIK